MTGIYCCPYGGGAGGVAAWQGVGGGGFGAGYGTGTCDNLLIRIYHAK
jgi:hypothetical protein